MENIKEWLLKCTQEEALLQFLSFDEEDALKLGLLYIEEGKNMGVPLSVQISINGSILFFHRTKGTSDHNNDWLKRKHNTVQKLHISTLHLFYQLLDEERELKKDLFLDPMNFAARGGGFPLILKGSGVVGSICVSGLPHMEDHALLIKVLRGYLAIA